MRLQATILAVLFAGGVPFGTGVGSVRAQIAEPLRLTNQNPLKDVFGRTLDSVGQENPARVDIFSVELGKPATLLTNTFVGENSLSHRGNFSTALSVRPKTGSAIRAVAYDAATSNDASFFCSATATVPATGRIKLNFGDLKPMPKFNSDIDAAYADALGRLHASGADSDHDGMSDYAEVLAGTSLSNSSSLLAFESIEPGTVAAPGTRDAAKTTAVILQWQSVPGRTYQIQYTSSLLPDEVSWRNVGNPVTAEDDETRIRVSVELEEEEALLRGHFRILLVL